MFMVYFRSRICQCFTFSVSFNEKNNNKNEKSCSFCLIWLRPWRYFRDFYSHVLELALIIQAGGLYGRILTEIRVHHAAGRCVRTRPRSWFSHTNPLSSVNKMFIIWQTRMGHLGSNTDFTYQKFRKFCLQIKSNGSDRQEIFRKKKEHR